MEIISHYRFKIVMMLFLMSGIVLTINTKADALSDQDTEQEERLISQELFTLFLNVNTAYTKAELAKYTAELENFTQKLKKRQHRYRSEREFLQYTFYKIHNRYLKHYRQHTDLYDLLDNGNYDCVSGSAFYGLILDALDIQYTIKELPFHIYLMVELQDEEAVVMLESTDALHGFVEDPQEIEERKAMYLMEQESDKVDYYTYDFEINSEIDLKQLAALNYYNEAVVYYNQQNLSQAIQYLNFATELYPAKRMEVLRTLIQQVTKGASTYAGR